jgi:SPP1 family predicted phage head-tail adaptor
MRRDKLITLQRRGSAQDSVGQTVETWTDISQAWATIKPITGREYFNASGERAEVTHRVSIWWISGVAPRDRVLYRSRVFDIKSAINVDERNKDLELMCVEGPVL